MSEAAQISVYRYSDGSLNHSHSYLLPALLSLLGRTDCEKRVFKLGCGNGSIASQMSKHGWGVTGVDPSTEGIEHAQSIYPELKLAPGSAYDKLAEQYGTFPVVASLEVVEHVYAPREYARTIYDLLDPGGIAIVSTPHHGYAKNLVLALRGKMDGHFTGLWDGGHIMFWSIKTLTTLFIEAGFVNFDFSRLGRVLPLAKSLILKAQKPV